jgi:hypothetical protein
VDGRDRIVYILRRLCYLGSGSNLLLKYPTLASPDWSSMGYSVGGPRMVVSTARKDV